MPNPVIPGFHSKPHPVITVYLAVFDSHGFAVKTTNIADNGWKTGCVKYLPPSPLMYAPVRLCQITIMLFCISISLRHRPGAWMKLLTDSTTV